MRTWTSTVSPTSNLGRSSRWPPSTRAMYLFFMTRFRPGRAPEAGLLPPPICDRPVVAAQEHVRDGHAAENARPRILRVLQPTGPVAVRLLDDAGRISKDARH